MWFEKWQNESWWKKNYIETQTISELLWSTLDDKFNNQYDVLPDVYEEMEKIKNEAMKNWTFMKWPNWKESNLPEKQWLLVRTKRFKERFGDRENDPTNASKIVDKNGEPLIVYHASDSNFTEFSKEKAKDRIECGRTFWFGSEKNPEYKEGSNIHSVFLKAVNPINIDDDKILEKILKEEYPTEYWVDVLKYKDSVIRKYIEQGKCDGILKYDRHYSSDSSILFGYPNVYIVSEPNQIKSIDNYWSFSNSDNNIKH